MISSKTIWSAFAIDESKRLHNFESITAENIY